MTVQHLSVNDFESPGGRVLKLRRPGLYFVMFKTQNCPHCVSFENHFRGMSQRELRVQFSTVDVQQYRQITGMAQTTNTPIRAVPMFIFYLNGAPFARYKGKHDPGTMLAFLNTMVQKTSSVANNTNFVQRASMPSAARRESHIGHSQQDLNHQREPESKWVPDGVVPYNEEWRTYMGMDQMQ